MCVYFSVFCCSGADGLSRTACKSRQIIKAEACENNAEMGLKRSLNVWKVYVEENRGLYGR